MFVEQFVLVIEREGKKRYVLTLENPGKGLKDVNRKALFGALREGNSVTPENFIASPDFLKLLHKVWSEDVFQNPEMLENAKKANDGYVLVIDPRARKTKGEAQKEDIIGAIEVKGGKIGKYSANPKYKLFTKTGFFRMPSPVEKKLFEEINK